MENYVRACVIEVNEAFQLHSNGIENFHLYTLNRSEMTKQIIENFKSDLINEAQKQDKKAS